MRYWRVLICLFFVAGCASPAQQTPAAPSAPQAQIPTGGPSAEAAPSIAVTTPTTASAAGTATMTATAAVQATPPPTGAPYVVNGNGKTTVEQAHAALLQEGVTVYLIFVSESSSGLEGEIYRDLMQRKFRMSAGTDEGFDTQDEFCYPDCLFVVKEEANVLTAAGWLPVLRHEYRHVVQARNNPNMARDFRDGNGKFTTYGAFSEACADYGLNVAPVYQAQERLDRVKTIVGTNMQAALDQACSGNPGAYRVIVVEYERVKGTGAFASLFPPYD